MRWLHYADPEGDERATRDAAKRERETRFKRDKRLKPARAKRKGKAYSASPSGDYLAKPPNEID